MSEKQSVPSIDALILSLLVRNDIPPMIPHFASLSLNTPTKHLISGCMTYRVYNMWPRNQTLVLCMVPNSYKDHVFMTIMALVSLGRAELLEFCCSRIIRLRCLNEVVYSLFTLLLYCMR